MTTNQTIDGVPRSTLEKLVTPGMDGGVTDDEWDELRALLDAPATTQCAMCFGTGDMHEPGCEPGSCARCDGTGRVPAAQPQDKPMAQKYDDTLLPFVALMRKELHANAGKGDRPGWLAMSSDTCLLEIIYHFGKLQKAVKNSDGDGMAEYAADVANMCMMLLDICGALGLVDMTEQPAPAALSVWYGAMPESNGKTNWTSILHRKGECMSEGITIDMSEYPDRVRYEADRMRYLIGELAVEPWILDYDADKHSGYVEPEHPAPVAVVPDGYCIMHRQLTAENGAKALLLGEFKLLVTKECPECCELEEPVEGCSICDGEGEYGQKHTIPWDQIKFIYSKAVSGLAMKAESAKT